MTNELTTSNDGTLREDGALVISRTEKPNGWLEIHKVGQLRIRGEKEPRTISYADYAKLLTFYTNQARLIKDRKHIMVALSGGKFVNTADITSLELTEAEKFVENKPTIPERLAAMPTEWVKFKHPDKPGIYCEALCHVGPDDDGITRTHKAHNEIKELREFRKDENGHPVICQVYKYGIPQL